MSMFIDVHVHRRGFPEANLIPEEISFLCFTRFLRLRTIESSQRKLIFFATLRLPDAISQRLASSTLMLRESKVA